jgi:REP-associated tyrosine transposase
MSATFYRHRLPHIRLNGAIYFVTWRLGAGQADLSDSERDCIVAAIRHFDGPRYAMHAYVVMNDHVHVLVQPAGDHRLEDMLRSWKSFTANQLRQVFGRRGAVWQDEYFDRVIRTGTEYDQKRDYIIGNPRKRWPDVEAYRWCWAVGMDLPAAP